jgi:hypothetical protein
MEDDREERAGDRKGTTAKQAQQARRGINVIWDVAVENACIDDRPELH